MPPVRDGTEGDTNSCVYVSDRVSEMNSSQRISVPRVGNNKFLCFLPESQMQIQIPK